MASCDAFIASHDTTGLQDGAESLIKKHEDFDKAITAQEQSIDALNSFADGLINANHYDGPAIRDKRDQVIERWKQLKKELIEQRS
ncbi:spectrin alpha chain, non-erythrocytic 1-like [Amphiura filiformis]|uniref:spectrin alpha chain, non-erythrocytic 1-like n=1 Tax=Amphiura filiformis TaxID=82378 RepID=UPI003B21CDF3